MKAHSKNTIDHRGPNRRQFMRSTAVAVGAATLGFPFVGRVLGANDRINIAAIGVGGKGFGDCEDAVKCGGNIIGICDVDQNALDQVSGKLGLAGVQQFKDYRKLLDVMAKDIDAVLVSTPDHHHGVASIRAMKLGKHCFCQKPLGQTIDEVRTMRQLAIEKGLATQMGNQGSASNGLRRAVEVVQAGIIGKPLELHVWSNRPVWPQGLDRPAGDDPVPAGLDWDAWLGPAPKRPYKKDVYHTFKWRGWFDFGTGALGDMACHTVNMPFRALKLGYPEVVELELASRFYSETYPKTSRIRFEFPGRDNLPPLKMWWYDGNPNDALCPVRPAPHMTTEILGTFDKVPDSGALIVGEKGKLFSPDDYGGRFFLVMTGSNEYLSGDIHEACKDIPQTIPRSPGHMEEWFKMMRDGTPAYSHFETAGYLTEVILLGCVALQLGEGLRMEWDGPAMRSPNLPGAARFVKRKNRRGWEA